MLENRYNLVYHVSCITGTEEVEQRVQRAAKYRCCKAEDYAKSEGAFAFVEVLLHVREIRF